MTNETYTAVLTETDLGKKIVLLKYERPGLGWWNRVYDATENIQPSEESFTGNKNAQPNIPKPTLEEALALSKEYVKRHNIKLADFYMDSIQLERAPANKGKIYWQITWLKSQPAKGGQIFIHIYMDRSVSVFYGE